MYLWNNSTYLPKYKASCLWKLHSQDKNTVPQCNMSTKWQQLSIFKSMQMVVLLVTVKWARFRSCTWLHSLAIGWTVLGSNPGSGKIFRTHPDQPWDPPNTKDTVPFPWIKQLGCGINHSCPYSNPACLHPGYRMNFIFTPTFILDPPKTDPQLLPSFKEWFALLLHN
jgi:hypothetical protein